MKHIDYASGMPPGDILAVSLRVLILRQALTVDNATSYAADEGYIGGIPGRSLVICTDEAWEQEHCRWMIGWTYDPFDPDAGIIVGVGRHVSLLATHDGGLTLSGQLVFACKGPDTPKIRRLVDLVVKSCRNTPAPRASLTPSAIADRLRLIVRASTRRNSRR